MMTASDFAQGDQVGRVKFEVRSQMKRFDMVHLQRISSVAAHDTRRLTQEMLFGNRAPLGTALMAMASGDVGTMVPSQWTPTALTP